MSDSPKECDSWCREQLCLQHGCMAVYKLPAQADIAQVVPLPPQPKTVTTATVPLPYAYMDEKGTVYVILCNGEAWSYRDGAWTRFEDEPLRR